MIELELIICIKMDLALNSLQRLIFLKTQTNKSTNKKPQLELKQKILKTLNIINLITLKPILKQENRIKVE